MMSKYCITLIVSGVILFSRAVVCVGEDVATPETMTPIPPPLTILPQYSGKNLPTPLSTRQEKMVFDAVFMRFSDVNREKTMAFIHEHFPREMHEFTLLSRRDLRRAMGYMIDLVDKSLELMNIRDQNHDVYESMIDHRELEERVKNIAKKLRGAVGSDVSKVEAELQDALKESFMAKQALMRIDIEQMDRQLNDLRSFLVKREQNSELIIRRRYDEISGDTARLEW